LAAKNHESHLERLKDIMEIFMDNEKYQTILSGNKETIIQLFA
ncbi:PTS sugar transporter subunit IIA, partial [Enterococcus lactis]|nr:PTS sugar transporter subunit IIA [Enterococcus lactis]